MLKEIAIADAYGAGFEFSNRNKIDEFNNLHNYQPHDLYGFLGKYTDDTQMSIAIAELILENSSWDKNEIANKFVECFKRDPRKGYSKGFFSLLSSVENGEALNAVIRPNSERNGAAMRAVPLGVIGNVKEVIYVASEQAKVTHNTNAGIDSSCAVALSAFYGLNKIGVLSELPNFLNEKGFGQWDYKYNTEVSMNAIETVSAALTCLLNTRDTQSLLLNCVALGGDTDSVAAIAVGLASCFEEYNTDMPKSLLDNFDELQYGFDFLNGLDEKLLGLVV